MSYPPRAAQALACFLLLFCVAGCSTVGPADSGGALTGEARPEAQPPALLLTNETDRAVCYFAGEESGMARMDFIFEDCTDAPVISAGETARVPYEEINFYDAGDERVWVAWRVKDAPDEGYASFKVSLR